MRMESVFVGRFRNRVLVDEESLTFLRFMSFYSFFSCTRCRNMHVFFFLSCPISIQYVGD